MDVDLVSSLINNNNSCHPKFYETEKAMMESESFEELADALLGNNSFVPNPSKTTAFNNPESWDIDYDLVDQFITLPPCNNGNNNNDNDDIFDNNQSVVNNADNLVGGGSESDGVVVQEQPVAGRLKKRKEVAEVEAEAEKKQAAAGSEGGKTRKRRHPNQVQDHIVAERKRREVLSHMFISLSSLVPGLKKMDKTTILGDAIKHMKHLQEKVKELELAVAQHTNTKSVVVVKKYQLSMNEDIDDDDNDNSSSSIVVDDISGSGSGGNNNHNNKKKKTKNSSSLPKIEVKKSDNNLLLKVSCEKRKEIFPELVAVVERHGLSITSSVVIPFDNSILDITIVAQMEEGFKINVNGFVRTLRSTLLRSTSP